MASSAIQLATAYVSLVISTKGVGKDVARELGAIESQAERVGKTAGSKLVSAFGRNKIDTSRDAAQLERLKDTAERASRTVAKSKQAEEDATRKVAIAQKAYEEAVSKSGDGSSRALAAQDRLITAQRKAEAAAHQTKAAVLAEADAIEELGRDADTADDKVQTFGDKFKTGMKGLGEKLNPFSGMKKHAEQSGAESSASWGGKFTSGVKGVVGTVGKLLGPLALVGGGMEIVGGLKDAVKNAGDLEQSVGAIQSVFKGSADQMLKWSESASTSVGLTKNEYNELGTLLGAQLKNGGTALDELGGKTNDLIGVGADLSSMFGGTTREAVEALSSALKGERDPIERYGVSLKQSAIDAKAAELGYKKVGGSFDNQAQQAATLALIMEQTSDAQGNFAKESDTYAHKVQVLSAKFEDMKTGLGERLLPVITTVLGWVDKALPLWDNFTKGVTGVTDILFKGDFNGEVFGLSEDDPIIDVLFKIREGGESLVNIGKLLFSGDFQGGIFGLEEDDPIIDLLFRLREGAQGVVEGFKAWAGPGGQAQDILAAVRGSVDKLVGVWRDKFAPIISEVWGRFVSAIQDNGPAISNVVATIKETFNTAGEVVRLACEKMGEYWQWAADRIVQVWNFISPIVLPIVDGLVTAVVGIFGGLWTALSGVMDLIVAVLKGDWGGAADAVKKIVGGLADGVKGIFNGLWTALSGIMSNIGKSIQSGWNSIWSWVSRKVGEIRDGVVNTFNQMKSGVDGVVNNLKNSVTNTVNNVKSDVVNTFNDMWKVVEGAFKTGVSAVSSAFDRIRDAAKAPVKFVINTVINDGLIDGINVLADKVGLGKPLSHISLPRGFAGGGILPGTSSYQQGDDQLIMARRGEGVTVSEALRDPFERKRLLAINKAALRGESLDEFRQHFDGFAGGGIVGYRGVTMDAASAKLLYMAEELYGGPFSPTQGSFRPRTSYSGGTHMGAGAIDLRSPSVRQVAALRRVGAAAWDRTGKGKWMPHTHAIFPVPGLSPSAAGQMASYKRGGDGLGGSDNGPGVQILQGLGDLASKAWDLFTKAGDAVLDFVSKPLDMFKDAVSGGLGKISSIPGGGVFNDILGKVPGLVVDGLKDWLADKVGIPKFANGGFTPGGPVLVGERGPEILSPPRNSYVTPNHALGQLAGVQQHITLKVPADAFSDVSKFLAFIEQLGLRARQA